MPGFLVHVGAQVMCAHGGQAQPTAPNPQVTVSGQPTVTITAPYTVVGCTLPPPSLANGPCVTATWTSGSTRVLSNGQPLVVRSGVPVGAQIEVLDKTTRHTTSDHHDANAGHRNLRRYADRLSLPLQFRETYGDDHARRQRPRHDRRIAVYQSRGAREPSGFRQ